MLGLSCKYWDAGAGTVEQTALSQKDQILTVCYQLWQYNTSSSDFGQKPGRTAGVGNVFKYSGELCRNFVQGVSRWRGTVEQEDKWASSIATHNPRTKIN